MKKTLVIIALWCRASLAMEPGPIIEPWQNEPVNQNIKEYFKIYFVEGDHKEFSPVIIDAIADALYKIPGIDVSKTKFDLRINQLLKQFVANLIVREKLERGSSDDKELNKKIEEMNKKITIHNSQAKKIKSEIKKLLTSKSNPVETLGGLAALLYEYSDRDPKLELFWRHIVLRSNGYYKEYFLYGQKDDEKTNKEPNSFYQIKTQRPKSWSSLVGLGNDYVDKRGWLSYAYGKLKLPALIGGGALVYRNRKAIGEKIDASGIKETRLGKWFGETYNKARGSTYAQKMRDFGSAVEKKVGAAYQDARGYLSNYYAKKGEKNYLKRTAKNRLKYGAIEDESEAELDRIVKSDKARREMPDRLAKGSSDQDLLWLQQNEQAALKSDRRKAKPLKGKSTIRQEDVLNEYQNDWDNAYSNNVNNDQVITRDNDYERAYRDYNYEADEQASSEEPNAIELKVPVDLPEDIKNQDKERQGTNRSPELLNAYQEDWINAYRNVDSDNEGSSQKIADYENAYRDYNPDNQGLSQEPSTMEGQPELSSSAPGGTQKGNENQNNQQISDTSLISGFEDALDSDDNNNKAGGLQTGEDSNNRVNEEDKNDQNNESAPEKTVQIGMDIANKDNNVDANKIDTLEGALKRSKRLNKSRFANISKGSDRGL